MTVAGLRRLRHLPKQVRTQTKEEIVRRWLVAFIIIALIALIAGFLTFGGADMGK
jgi:hypothetical protein